MKSVIKFSVLTIVLIIAFSSCKKTAGPKGDTGPAGANGANGTNGTNGAANITVSTYTVASSSWTINSWPYNYAEAVLMIPAITSTVFTNGDVRLYIADATGTQWVGMPYDFFSAQYNYKVKTGEVDIEYTLYNNSVPTNPGVQVFKVVIFPPAFIKNNPGTDWNDYEAVKSKFNLE